jgi:hypothetical protein
VLRSFAAVEMNRVEAQFLKREFRGKARCPQVDD